MPFGLWRFRKVYDDAFIEYTAQMIKKCKEYGFRVIMDPHQDIVGLPVLCKDFGPHCPWAQFSRFSGGDGAPYWALLAAGMEPRNFTKTNAAIIHSEWPSPDAPDPLSMPDMIWATGYQRLAAQTLTTLFFAGRDYAPKCIIDGVNIQDYLQQHYLDALSYFATKIATFESGALLDCCIIGWDSINEPNPGYLGHENLSILSPDDKLRVGPMPTAFQAMRLGMGQAVEVEKWKFTSTGPSKDGTTIIDPGGNKAWLSKKRDQAASSKYGWNRDPGWQVDTCIWAQHKVWDIDGLTLVKPEYFAAEKEGPNALFSRKYWKQHWQAHARVIRAAHPEAIHFVHTPVFKVPPLLSDLPEVQNRAAFSTHFYDGVTLVTKHWNWFNYDAIGVLRGKYRFQWQGLKVGESAIRNVMRSQIGILRQDGLDALGNYPSYMGEIGIPFDLDGRKSYTTGDYTEQTKALDASMNGCDGSNVMNYTMWNFCKDNSHLHGDQWVGEDLSLWSPDDMRQEWQSANDLKASSGVSCSSKPSTPLSESPSHKDSNDGARALLAFVRPYPFAIVGIPTNISFDIHSASFKLDIELPPGFVSDDHLASEIYLPFVHFGATPLSQASNESSVNLPLIVEPPSLSLDVKVSEGRWETEGQLLRWHYGRPSASEGIKKLQIEIKRKGRPRVTLQQLYGAQGWFTCAEDLVSCSFC